MVATMMFLMMKKECQDDDGTQKHDDHHNCPNPRTLAMCALPASGSIPLRCRAPKATWRDERVFTWAQTYNAGAETSLASLHRYPRGTALL